MVLSLFPCVHGLASIPAASGGDTGWDTGPDTGGS
jgi:hypothetical protein